MLLLLLWTSLTPKCVSTFKIQKRNFERFSGRHANQFSSHTIWDCNDLFWLLNNNTRHSCEYNHDTQKKIRHKWKSVLNLSLYLVHRTVNWNGKCDFRARKRAQSDHMCVCTKRATVCVSVPYWNGASNVQWVRSMPFVLKYFECLNWFYTGLMWIQEENMKLITMFCSFEQAKRLLDWKKIEINFFGANTLRLSDELRFILVEFVTKSVVVHSYCCWHLRITVQPTL